MRLTQFIFTVITGMALLIGSASQDNGIVILALVLGSVGMFIYAAALVIMDINQTRIDTLEAEGRYARQLASLDPDQWNALGLHFPTMRTRLYMGELIDFFEDTKARREHIEKFLETSDDKQISPVRYWVTKEMPAWAHREIRIWLEHNGYVTVQSHAGNHSWLWVGNSYRHLAGYWLTPRNLKELEGDM